MPTRSKTLSRSRAGSHGRRSKGRWPASAVAAVLVVLALTVSVASLALAATPAFQDVPASHPYSAAIVDLADRGFINGYGDGTFGPDDPVTRQQFAKMIVLAGGYPVSESDVCPFVDVTRGGPSTLYPDNFVAVAAARQITLGTDSTRFSPLRHITRLQVVSMAVRMADDVRPGCLAEPLAGWTGDAVWRADATHGATAARAEYNGLLEGLALSVLDPYGEMDRGEVAQVLHNLLIRLATSASTSPASTSTTSTSTTSTTSVPAMPPMPEAFEDLGGAISSAPAACCRGYGLIDVFARGAGGTVVHMAYGEAGWSQWQDLGGSVKPGSHPAAVSWGRNRVDVFTRGDDDALWHAWWDGSSWSAWESLGGVLASSPAAAYTDISGASKSIDVFVVGPDDTLWRRTFDGTSWSVWIPRAVSGPSLQPGCSPAASTWGAMRIDLVVCGVDGGLLRTYLPPGGYWMGWDHLGGVATSSPSVCTWGSWAEGRLDVFVRGANGGLWHRSVVSSLWTRWEDMEVGHIESAPAAVSWGRQRIDVFVRGANDALWHRWYEDSAWLP